MDLTDSLLQTALLGAPETEEPVLVTVAKTFPVSLLKQFFHQV